MGNGLTVISIKQDADPFQSIHLVNTDLRTMDRHQATRAICGAATNSQQNRLIRIMFSTRQPMGQKRLGRAIPQRLIQPRHCTCIDTAHLNHPSRRAGFFQQHRQSLL